VEDIDASDVVRGWRDDAVEVDAIKISELDEAGLELFTPVMEFSVCSWLEALVVDWKRGIVVVRGCREDSGKIGDSNVLLKVPRFLLVELTREVSLCSERDPEVEITKSFVFG